MKEFAPKKQSEWQILGHLAALNPRFRPRTMPTPTRPPPRILSSADPLWHLWHTSAGLLWPLILLPRQSTAPLPPGIEFRFLNEFKWVT